MKPYRSKSLASLAGARLTSTKMRSNGKLLDLFRCGHATLAIDRVHTVGSGTDKNEIIDQINHILSHLHQLSNSRIFGVNSCVIVAENSEYTVSCFLDVHIQEYFRLH